MATINNITLAQNWPAEPSRRDPEHMYDLSNNWYWPVDRFTNPLFAMIGDEAYASSIDPESDLEDDGYISPPPTPERYNRAFRIRTVSAIQAEQDFQQNFNVFITNGQRNNLLTELLQTVERDTVRRGFILNNVSDDETDVNTDTSEHSEWSFDHSYTDEPLSDEQFRRIFRTRMIRQLQQQHTFSFNQRLQLVETSIRKMDVLRDIESYVRPLPCAHVDLLGVGKFADSLSDLNDQIDRVDIDAVNEFINKLNASGVIDETFIGNIDTLAKGIKSGSSTMNDINDAFNTFTSALPMNSIKFVGGAAVIASVYFGYQCQKKPTKQNVIGMVITAVAAIATLGFTTELLGVFTTFFSHINTNCTNEEDLPDAHISMSVEELVKPIIIFFTGYVTATTGKDTPAAAFKNLNSYNRVLENAVDIIKFIVACIERAVNLVRQYLYTQVPDWRIFNDQDSPMSEVFTRLDKINTAIAANEYYDNEDNYDHLCDTIEIARVILRNTTRNSANLTAINEINKIIADLDKKKEIMHVNNVGLNVSRPEPVLLMLRGPAGVFKSGALNAIAYAWLAQTTTGLMAEQAANNPETFIHHSGADKFHDTYNPNTHRIWVHDDWGQEREAPGEPDSTISRTIKMVNSAPYILKCADISNKGLKPFKSDLIIYTSNISRVDTTNIIHPEAIERRFENTFTVRPKQEYRKNKSESGMALDGSRLDMGKIPVIEVDGIEISDLKADQLEFFKTNLKGEVLSDKVYTADQLATYVANLTKKKAAWHKRQMQVLKEVFKRNVPEDIYPENVIQLQEVDPQGNFDNVKSKIPRRSIKEDTEDFSYYDQDVLGAVDQWLSEHEHGRHHHEFAWINQMYNSRWNIYDPRRFLVEIITMYGTLITDWLDGELAFSEVLAGIQENYVVYYPKHSLSAVFYLPLREAWLHACAYVYKKVSGFFKTLNLVLEEVYHTALWLMKNDPFLRFYIPVLVLAIGSNIAVGIFQGFCRFFGVQDVTEAQSSYKIPVKNQDSNSIKAAALARSVQPHMGANPNSQLECDSTVRQSMYQIDVFADKEQSKYDVPGYLIFVVGQIAIMPYHFITNFNAAVDSNPDFAQHLIRFTRVKGVKGDIINRSSFSCSVNDILSWHDCTPSMQAQDICVIKVPIQVVTAHSKKVLNCLISEKELEEFGRSHNQVRIAFPAFSTSSDRIADARIRTTPLAVGSSSGQFCIQRTMYYTAPMCKGECGGMVTTINHNFRIVGIHSAGLDGSSQAWGSILTKEMFNEWYIPYEEGNIYTEFATADLTPIAQNSSINRGQFCEIGRIPSNLIPANNTKVDIVHSRLYGAWDHLLPSGGPAEAPAPLNMMYRDPRVLENMYAPYCCNNVLYPGIDKELEPVWKRLLNDLIDVSPFSVKREIYTFEYAAGGSDYDPDWHSIARNTSPGWPLNKKYSKNGEIFGTEERFNFIKPSAQEVKAELIAYLEKCQLSIRDPKAYRDFGKGERRSLLKVLGMFVRLISGGALVYLIAVRMYFGAFMLWIYKNRIRNGIAIGVNHYGDEWHQLVLYLQEVNQVNANAGDYKRYDGSLFVALLWSAFNIMDGWYNDEHTHIRLMLFLEIVYSYHCFDGDIVEWIGSMPSGNPLTAIINSLCNLILLRWSWWKIVHNHDFADFVRAIVLGDDNNFTVHPALEDVFNEYSIAPILAQVGMQYTPEDKSPVFLDIRRPLTSTTFLKRTFRFNKDIHRWVAPFDLAKALEMPYWCRKYDDNTTKDTTRILLTELAIHGPETFVKYAPTILSVWREQMPDLGYFVHDTYYDLLIASRGEKPYCL